MRFLFTSPSEPSAIALARVLAAEGHIVYAAEEESTWGTSPARYSRAYKCFYRLTPSLSLARTYKSLRDKLDYIIPFRELNPHIRDRLERRGAKVWGRRLFENNLEFQDFVRATVIGQSLSAIKVPAAFEVVSRRCVGEILGMYPGTKFRLLLRPGSFWEGAIDDEDTLVDVSSPSRCYGILGETVEQKEAGEKDEGLLLSCATLNDSVVDMIQRLPISEERPYRMIEVAEGGALYQAHALVNGGRIRTFVVTTNREPESSQDRNFIVVAPSQVLFKVLYRFTEKFVDAFNHDPSATAIDLTLTFRVKEEVHPNGNLTRKITATSYSPSSHPSLILLASIPELRRPLALAYTTPPPLNPSTDPLMLPPFRMLWGLYSASSAVSSAYNTFSAFALLKYAWWTSLMRTLVMSLVWGVCFQEEIWDWTDPGPALCSWLVALVRFLWKQKYVYVMRRFVGSKKWIMERGGLWLGVSIAGFFWKCLVGVRTVIFDECV